MVIKDQDQDQDQDIMQRSEPVLPPRKPETNDTIPAKSLSAGDFGGIQTSKDAIMRLHVVNSASYPLFLGVQVDSYLHLSCLQLPLINP